MTMPKSYSRKFIGRLIALQAEHKDNTFVFERLCTAVKQCRDYNAGDEAERAGLLPRMEQTRKELHERGVMVG